MPPVVTIADRQPTEATITWSPDPRAHHYFIQYTAGKFPTQATLTPAPGDALMSYRLEGLRAGRTYSVEVCASFSEFGCPGGLPPQSCTTVLQLTAPLSYAQAKPVAPDRVACDMEDGLAFQGDSPGYPYADPVPAVGAEECCQKCAAVEPNLPYQDQCLFFVYEEQSHACYFKKNSTGGHPSPHTTSGKVVSWPALKMK